MHDTLQGEPPASLEELACDWQARCEADPTDLSKPLHLAFIEQASRRMIGNVLWKPKATEHRVVEVGYVVLSDWQGQGFATEALGSLLERGFRERGAERVEARIFVGNEPSRRLVERLGFQFEGTGRRASCKRGVWVNHWVFGLTRLDVSVRRGRLASAPKP